MPLVITGVVITKLAVVRLRAWHATMMLTTRVVFGFGMPYGNQVIVGSRQSDVSKLHQKNYQKCVVGTFMLEAVAFSKV
ncbi:uncharacterized protein TrAFT101_010732 [Trichoderma asperellum]|uniref:uncharacterized protein n=1 Tax=Trichoderma asperellum TaxID=101201 RepID=UPI00332129E2|nr:hypothetical protein TrAFT101_010732 [Trichoderma asperellum]